MRTCDIDEHFPEFGTTVSPWHPPGSVVASTGLFVAKSGRKVRSDKPMPAAGETVHVRRLLVVRSRCGLEVSPASATVQMTVVSREGQ